MFITHTIYPNQPTKEVKAFREVEDLLRMSADLALNATTTELLRLGNFEVSFFSNVTGIQDRARRLGRYAEEAFSRRVGDSPRKNRLERILVAHQKHITTAGGRSSRVTHPGPQGINEQTIMPREAPQSGGQPVPQPKIPLFGPFWDRSEEQGKSRPSPFSWLERLDEMVI